MFNTFNLFKTILSTSNTSSSPCLFRSQLKPLLIYFKINANYLQKPIIILTINSIKKKVCSKYWLFILYGIRQGAHFPKPKLE